jgi:hypothetical protein
MRYRLHLVTVGKLMPNKKLKLRPQAPALSPDEVAKLAGYVHEAIYRFKGNISELESALGFMFMGRYYGWKVLHIVHSKRTVNKYESILGFKVKEEFEPLGPYAERSRGWRLVKNISNFWKVINGDIAWPEGDRQGTLGP